MERRGGRICKLYSLKRFATGHLEDKYLHLGIAVKPPDGIKVTLPTLSLQTGS